MLKHSAWLFIFCLASKDLELLLSLSTNIDWHIIIHVYSQSPEKVMIFSSPWLPLLEPAFPPITPHQKEKKPVTIQVYEVLCSPLLSFVIDFYVSNNQRYLYSGNCLSLLCATNGCWKWTSIKINNESSKLSFPSVCVCVWWRVTGEGKVFLRGCW